MYSVVLLAAMTTGAGAQEFHHARAGFGCYGACYGGWGGCFGCHGGWGGCHGCWGGGWGGGWGHACFGAYQCHGCFGCSGWTGCHGCFGCYGPVVGVPVAPAAPPGPMPQPEPVPNPEEIRANLTVELPEDAKLYVDNVLMKSVSAKRDFITPPLEKGKTYYYNLKAEMERDGQTITVNGQVVIQPGQHLQAALTEPTAQGTFVVKTNGQN